jgi:Zn-ribbon RNA-binding protein
MMKCTSCKREVTDDYVKFKCPQCGKNTIVRCMKCRDTVTPYVCDECGFTGP